METLPASFAPKNDATAGKGGEVTIAVETGKALSLFSFLPPCTFS